MRGGPGGRRCRPLPLPLPGRRGGPPGGRDHHRWDDVTTDDRRDERRRPLGRAPVDAGRTGATGRRGRRGGQGEGGGRLRRGGASRRVMIMGSVGAARNLRPRGCLRGCATVPPLGVPSILCDHHVGWWARVRRRLHRRRGGRRGRVQKTSSRHLRRRRLLVPWLRLGPFWAAGQGPLGRR